MASVDFCLDTNGIFVNFGFRMDTKAIDNGNIGSSLSFEADIRNAV